jgi:metal-sulfur cluster biosynthetic enzyme
MLACVLSWREFVNEVRGKSYLSTNIGNIPHTARTYLQQLRDQGIQVRLDADPPWDADKIIHNAQRGAHPSATVHRHFLHGEFADFIDAGFWVVLPLAQLHALPEADLRLSPMAVKEEFNR